MIEISLPSNRIDLQLKSEINHESYKNKRYGKGIDYLP